MIRILDITGKDLLQFLRDRKTFLFMLIMPVAFTIMFGFAFGGFGGDEESDSRLPVGYLDQDNRPLSHQFHDLLAASEIIRLEEDPARTLDDLQILLAEGKLAGAVIVPPDYSRARLHAKTARLILIADVSSASGTTVKSEILSAASRLDSAISTALVLERVSGDTAPFDYALDEAISAWKEPPIRVVEAGSVAAAEKSRQESTPAAAHTSPGMMLQFSIAGLLTTAQVIVSERKSRTLQRLLTTATSRLHILLGHYLAMLALIFVQFFLLIGFGQLVLKVNYMASPSATFLVAFTASLCMAGMGLLIGVAAKNEDQAVTFSLIPMFLFAGLGGAWVPLEVTGPTFQAIGHLTPVAWGMDGFKNVVVRGWGLESALLPAAALLGYAVVFFALAAWRLWASEER